MRILVTGANGYIAPFVMAAFRAAKHIVIGTDVGNPGPGIVVDEWIKADLTQRPEAARVMARKPDVVCHLAAEGNVYKADEDPARASFLGPVMTGVLLEAVTNADKTPRFIYTSTWEVYGPPEYEPMDESHPAHPESFYADAKLSGERMALLYGAHRKVPVTVLRLGSAYGPNMRGKSVFSIFRDRAAAGQFLTIFGDGSQFRQWTHVLDIGRAFVMAATKKAAVGQVFNVVSDEKVTIKELATLIADRYGAKLTYSAPRPGDVSPAEVTSAKIKRILGWQPEVDFASALAEMHVVTTM